ncbi:MAG: helix-turn-helix domain-containing protein [Chlorobiaceae bacterium]|nr:helix-turn-helix domain-containing protein [Chlorobiaceae bacterium]NTW73950.1 helix-turn-helix domain-containing protein [Chlorobiaceae bacterium]
MPAQPPLPIGARIRQVRRHFSLRQDEFGRKIGISGSRISELEHDKGGAGAGVLVAICQQFPVSHKWMLTGEGPMLKTEPPAAPTETAAGNVDLSRRLGDLERQIRLILLDKARDGDRLVEVPLYSSAVAAGLPGLASSDVEETIEIPAAWSHGRKNLFAVRVQGESMLDAGIMPGDRLLVETTQTARDLQIVIASIDGEMTVKKLNIGKDGTVRLEPQNNAYEPITITPEMDFRILGVVLAALRTY